MICCKSFSSVKLISTSSFVVVPSGMKTFSQSIVGKPAFLFPFSSQKKLVAWNLLFFLIDLNSTMFHMAVPSGPVIAYNQLPPSSNFRYLVFATHGFGAHH